MLIFKPSKFVRQKHGNQQFWKSTALHENKFTTKW